MAEVFIQSRTGRVEGRYHCNPNPAAPVALILPPDPRQGATMNNKVVYTLFNSFINAGFTVLRINYPGVGKSQGFSDGFNNEFSASSDAYDWLQAHNAHASLFWIAGVSFGSCIALNIAVRRPDIVGFIMVAPLASHSRYDFSFAHPCPVPGIVIHGNKDTIAKPHDVAKLVGELQNQNNGKVEHKIIEDCCHFFTNKLTEFQSICEDYVNTTLAVGVRKPVRKKRRRRKKRDKCGEEY